MIWALLTTGTASKSKVREHQLILPVVVSAAELSALIGIFVSAGGLFGAFFLSGIDTRFGIVGAMVSLAIPGVAGSLIIGSAGRFVNQDLDRMINQVVEEEEINRIRAGGGHLPMLACRSIDFAYGKLQVLFGAKQPF